MTKTPEQTQTLLESNLGIFVQKIAALHKNGWEFDAQQPPGMHGFMYEASMWRNPTDIQRAEQPPLTRAEILAKARAAKTAKALERAQASGEEPTDEEEQPCPFPI